MTTDELAEFYRDYIACLNRRDWPALRQFVHEDVAHNARPLGLPGYRAMLERDIREIPDLQFHIEMLISAPPRIAARTHGRNNRNPDRTKKIGTPISRREYTSPT